jgi:O-acetyl-ADP-ribose deacetylase
VITILKADITTLRVDAIVNAANEALRGGGGVDGAIHRAAGPQLLEELRNFPSCPTGGAVLTKGYRLPARYVIHAVGPVWRGGRSNEPALLERAYESSFARANERRDVRTIAFPAISTGVYSFPKEQAARIAVQAMRRHESEFDEIFACLFDDENLELYESALSGDEP